jgi:hypothetical protein
LYLVLLNLCRKKEKKRKCCVVEIVDEKKKKIRFGQKDWCIFFLCLSFFFPSAGKGVEVANGGGRTKISNKGIGGPLKLEGVNC